MASQGCTATHYIRVERLYHDENWQKRPMPLWERKQIHAVLHGLKRQTTQWISGAPYITNLPHMAITNLNYLVSILCPNCGSNFRSFSSIVLDGPLATKS